MQNGRQGYPNTIYHPSNFGIGFDEPDRSAIDASALIEMKAVDKGLLIPRMTADQMTAIIEPANSLLIYNTTDSVFNYYDEKSETWAELQDNSKGLVWEYSNDNIFLYQKFNYVGIGTQTPQKKLHIYTNIKQDPHNQPATIRTETYYKTSNVWDIENNETHLDLNFGQTKEEQFTEEAENKFSFTSQSYFGLGTNQPQQNIHINNQEEATIRLESNSKNKFYAWDIQSNRDYLKLNFGNQNNTQVTETETKFIFTENSKLGIGTANPEASLQIKDSKDKPNIILSANESDFEIVNKKGKIDFYYSNTSNENFSLINYNPNSIKIELLENVTIDKGGNVVAKSFSGDGSDLKNLPKTSIWEEKNLNNISYQAGNVGIGKPLSS